MCFFPEVVVDRDLAGTGAELGGVLRKVQEDPLPGREQT